jgi:hypothetical protein
VVPDEARRLIRVLHREQGAALGPVEAVAHHGARGAFTDVAQLARTARADEGDGHVQPACGRGHAVRGQGPVDAELHAAIEQQLAAPAAIGHGAMLGVIAQRTRVPALERALGREVRVRGLRVGPVLAALQGLRQRHQQAVEAGDPPDADRRRGDAGDQRRVQQHHAIHTAGQA